MDGGGYSLWNWGGLEVPVRSLLHRRIERFSPGVERAFLQCQVPSSCGSISFVHKKGRYTHQSPTTWKTCITTKNYLPTQVPIAEQFQPPSSNTPLVPYSANNVILHLQVPRVLDPSYITPSYISQKRPLYPLNIHIPRPQQTD